MRVFVTGITGQLGHDVINELMKRGHKAIGTARRVPDRLEYPVDETVLPEFIMLDLTDETAVKQAIADLHPDAIIHCAAWTAVDAAEEKENRDAVFRANVLATKYLAVAAKNVNAKMLYLSTDYVFDGQGTRPWQADDKNYAPLNVYGQSKLDGELEVSSILNNFFIVRIAWVFGVNGKNFIRTMLSIGKTHDTVRVVNDQVGTPTYTYDLARLLVDMVETEKYGYYHATNSEESPNGYITWYEFTKEIYRQAGMKTTAIPVTTAEYGGNKAVRPFNSRLDKTKLEEAGFEPLPTWKDALHRFLIEIGEIT